MEGMYILKPTHCPNCGCILSSIVGIIDTHGQPAKKFMAVGDCNFTHGYDCYCEYCEWSGDIYPDRHCIRRDKDA